jgi:hypothetical protein
MDATKVLVVVLLAIILVFLIIFGPIFTIWSLNTLFPIQIPISFQSWAAVIWLMTIIHGIKFQLKKS